MSNTRSEFEKYFKENHADSFYSVDAALKIRGDDYIYFHAADLWAVWQHQQSKIDELQKGNDALVHVIKSRDIQLENEKHEYDELMNKLVDSGMKNTELQKRLDAALQLVNEMNGKRYPFSAYADQLEQALKGGCDEAK